MRRICLFEQKQESELKKMLNKKAVDFAIFQAKMAMAGFEIKLTSKGEIRGVKRGAKLGKAEAKSANNPNFKTNSLASLS